MNTPDSPTPPPHPLFQGPFYNRRRLLQVKTRKPLISRLVGTSTWVCRMRDDYGTTHGNHGFGSTPTAAYRDWKSKVGLWY